MPNGKTLPVALLFCAVWLFLFCLYYPAANAGFVTDFTGWLDQVRNHRFREYINRTNFQAKSLYQVTQLATYIFYKLFGTNAWLWHILFLTMHATNIVLAFTFCRRLLGDVAVKNADTISLTGVLLYCVSPYMSETIVWEPAFHFLTGLMMILVILLHVQRFIYTGALKHAAIAIGIYLVSTLTLEVFYITPWLALALGFFYANTGDTYKEVAGKIAKYFFAPMLSLFVLRLLAFRVVYGGWVSRIGTDTVTAINAESFGKPAKYLFHLLFAGRYFSDEMRQQAYSFCDSTTGLLLFYGVVAAFGVVIIMRFSKMSGKTKTASLLFVYMLITLALLIPVWFSSSQLVLFDRYTYFTAPFFYMLLAVVISMISWQVIRITIVSVAALVNLRFAILVSRYWGKSAKVISGLLHSIPVAGNKTILLLNLPENMHGVAMIGADHNSEYKLMNDLLLPNKKIPNTVYDVLSYNMQTPDDGAHVMVVSNNSLHVTLNQWGTWWWFEGKGAYSYENSDYKLNLIDAGHWYELTLKKPADQYLLLYQVGDKWKAVDMNKVNVDQN